MNTRTHKEIVDFKRDSLDYLAYYRDANNETKEKLVSSLQPDISTINIGKTVPDGAVNLAYVGSPSISPANTVSISDLSGSIGFNQIEKDNNYSICVVDPVSNLFTVDGETSVFPKVPVSVTNYFCERKTNNDPLTPLFYKYRLKNTININNLERIKIESVPTGFIYEIRPTAIGQNTDEYYIDIFSNISTSSKKPLIVSYIPYHQIYTEANYGSSNLNQIEEMLSMSPCFTEIYIEDLNNTAIENAYSIEQEDLYNKIKVRTKASKVEVPNENFKYQIESEIQVLYNKLNPGTINIGVMVIGEEVLRQQDISSSLRSIKNIMPSYLNIMNPLKSDDTNSYDYWELPIKAPLETLYIYDLIIVSGYDSLDIGSTNLIEYINNGGKVILDNCGIEEHTMDILWPLNSPTDINFSKTAELQLSELDSYLDHDFIDRIYNLKSQMRKFATNQYLVTNIDFSTDEDEWIKIFQCSNDENTVLAQRKIGKGTLVVSSIGLFTNMAANIMRLTANILHTLAEQKYVKSPMFVDNIIRSNFIDSNDTDYFYDIDNIFKKRIKPAFNWLNHINQKYITSIKHSMCIYDMNNSLSNKIFADIKDNDLSKMYAYYDYVIAKSDTKQRKFKFKEAIKISIEVLTYSYKYNPIEDEYKHQVIGVVNSDYIIDSGNIVRLTDLASMIPNIPGELYDSDIFVKISFKNSLTQRIPANLVIGDINGTNLSYDVNGENVFPIEQVQNLFVFAEYCNWSYYHTTYYGVKYNNTKSIMVRPCQTDDERDCWFPEVSDCYLEIDTTQDTIPTKTIYTIPQYYARSMQKKLTRSDFANSVYDPFSITIPFDDNSIIIKKEAVSNSVFMTPFMAGEIEGSSSMLSVELKSSLQAIDQEFSCTLECDVKTAHYSVTITYYDAAGDEILELKQHEPDSPKTVVIKEHGSARSFSIHIHIDQNDIKALETNETIILNLSLYYLMENCKIVEDKAIYIDDHTIKVNRNELIQSSLSAYIKKNKNEQIVNDILIPNKDRTIWTSSNKNWLYRPAPKIYDRGNPFVTNAYHIDYENGTIHVKNPGLFIDLTATYTCTGKKVPLTIIGLDTNNGYVKLAENIKLSDSIYTDYTYKNRYYSYRGYKDNNTFVHLDLNPSFGHFYTSKGIIDGKVDYINSPSTNLVGKTIVLYLLPRYVLGYDGSELESNEWPLRHEFNDVDTIKEKYPYAIPLALININSSADINDITVIDSRSYGGGLKEDISIDTINTKDVGSKYFWDISPWNGVAYQSNGVIIIRLPKYLIAENGKFDEDYIKEVIHKRLPKGIMPIIEYI